MDISFPPLVHGVVARQALHVHVVLLVNSYITGVRDVQHLLHRSQRAHAQGLSAINAIHPKRT